jgi:glutamate dehydrogenase
VDALAALLPKLTEVGDSAGVRTGADVYAARGVPEQVAARVAALDTLYSTLDIVEIGDATGRRVELVAQIYFAVSTHLGVPWLRARIAELPEDQHWRRLAKGAMLDDLSALQRTVTAEVLTGGGAIENAPALIDAWRGRNARAIERETRLLDELRAASLIDPPMLAVALRELRTLT